MMKKNIRSEDEIIKNWTSLKPVLTICCLAFNHEKYIEDALESFLMQETNFPFEILINDDASQDNTADIIRLYEKKYPHIIKPFYQKENLFSKSINATSTIMIPNSKGKYIAYCEGDDYWTDKFKLQKSVDFLENNKDFSACAHDVDIINENRDYVKETPYGHYHGDLNSISDQIRYNNIPTLSLVFRKSCFDCILFMHLKENTKYIGDIQMKCMLLSKGKIKYIDEKMGVYRWIKSGGSSFSSQAEALRLSDTIWAIFNVYYYIEESRSYYIENILSGYIKNFKKIIKECGREDLWEKLILGLKEKSLYRKFMWFYIRRKLTPRFIRKILEKSA